MLLNISDSSLLISQSLRRIVSAQLLDEFSGSAADVPGEVDGVDALQDDVVGLHRVCAGEWRRAGQQLEHEHAQGPVIGRDVVTLV